MRGAATTTMHNKRSAPGCSGHTLVELLLAAAIAGVLAAVGMPALGALVKDHRRSTVANELLASVLLARAEAAKSGQTVIVCGIADADGDGLLVPAERACRGRDWSGGWITAVWTDADGDGSVAPGELRVLREFVSTHRAVLSVTANAFTATPPITPAGTAALRPFSRSSTNGTIAVCDARGGAHARAVIIAANGRARVSRTAAGGEPLSCP
jgi:type IV fimbrial biogenesis protein FimT